MKLQFNHQEFQTRAVNAAVRVFDGQPLAKSDFALAGQNASVAYAPDGTIANFLQLSDEQLLANVQKVQADNGVAVSDALIASKSAKGKDKKEEVFCPYNFTLEMEALCEHVEENEIRLSELLNPRKKPAIMLVSRNIVGGISIETLAILEHFFGYCREAKTADPLWNEQAFKISRYKYFCQPDKSETEKFDRHISTLINCSKKD